MVGVRGDRGLQVQGVGQVDLAVDAHGPGHAGVGQRDVEVPGLGRGEAFGLGGLGVEPGLGLLDQPPQLRGADGVRERRDLGVHERRRLRGQTDGAVGDEREPPRRQLTRLDPGPAPREPVVPLDRVGEVAAPGLGGTAHGGGELDDRELRHLRTPLPTEWQGGLVPLIDRPDQRLTRVHRRPPRGRPHHLAGPRRPRPPRAPAQSPTRRRGRRSRERERVQGRGHRGTNSTTDHRHPPGAGSPLWTRVAAPRVCTESGPRPVPWDGSRRRRRCGGFETVAARPPQPPCGADPTTAGPQPARRRTGPRHEDVPALAAEVSRRSQRDLLNHRVARTRIRQPGCA